VPGQSLWIVVQRVTMVKVLLRVLQFSPVSIIPPLLHTHSYIYHPRCIMFFSQYFSFPCQYHSTIAPYSFIHLPPTLYNVYLPVLQFSPVSIIPPLLHTHLHVNSALIRSSEPSNKALLYLISGSIGEKSNFVLLGL
jgi:branched-subunit amino acid transport protein